MEDLHSDNELDNVFRDGLEGFEMEPSGKVWDDIEERLDGKSRRPKFIFWLSGLAGLLLTGAAFFLVMNYDTLFPAEPKKETALSTTGKNHENKNKIIVAANTVNTETNTNTVNATPGKQAGLNSNTKQTNSSVTNASSEILLPLKNKKEEQKIVNDPVIADPVSLAENKNKLTAKNKPTVVLADSTASANIVIKEKKSTAKKTVKEENKSDQKNEKEPLTDPLVGTAKNTTGNDPEKTGPVSGTDKGNSDLNLKKKETKELLPVNTDPITIADKGKAGLNLNKKSAADSIQSTSKVVSDTSLTASIPADTLAAKKDSTLATVKDSAKKEITAPLPDPFTAIAISTYFSPEYFMPQVSSAQENFSSASETHDLRYSFGLKAEYRPVRILGIQLGAAYSEISQQSSVQRVFFPKNISTPYTFYGSLGEMQVDPDVMKDGFSPLAPMTQFPADYKYTQKVSFINIPVNLKLHFGKKKFGFTVLAGLNTQYALKQHSQVTLIKEHFENVVNYSDVKVNKLNYSALAGIGFEYKLSKRIGILLEPNMRYNFSNLSRLSSISNKPVILGANAGILIYVK
ncbi:MAG: outer membrane beta-barrel protein [Bacteroidia bacterium]